MRRRSPRVGVLAGAGLLLLLAGAVLAWRSVTHHRDTLTRVQADLSESIQERDRLRNELAEERLQRQALEQVWSGKLETAQSAKTVAEQRLGECEMRARRP